MGGFSPEDFKFDVASVKYGIDKNNVLVYTNGLMTKGDETYDQKTELTEYNIENFNPFNE